MPYNDPRLANATLLALAARRLQHRQAQPPDWEQGHGLAALLESARRLPRVDPWDLPGIYEGAPGLAGLLWAARQWAQAPPPLAQDSPMSRDTPLVSGKESTRER